MTFLLGMAPTRKLYCRRLLQGLSFVIAGHSRPKDGVASLAYDPAIQLLTKGMDARVNPGHDGGACCNRADYTSRL
jgi:hypothetical protein